MNRWPLADTVDENRGRPLKKDIFLHYGIFPSDGNLEAVYSQSLANEFIRQCEAYFSRQNISIAKKNLIQRTASWLYLACPHVITESVRKNLVEGLDAIQSVDLHTMGLCFEELSDIKSFFAALEQIFVTRRERINEWLRTSRNIVRFREHALRPEVVSQSRLENIFSGILRSLNHEIDISHFDRIFDNCVLSILYLLKRRRYEPDFMTSDSEHYKRLDDIFSTLIKRKRKKLSDRQYKIVSITLRFLRQEASYADLQGIMVEY